MIDDDLYQKIKAKQETGMAVSTRETVYAIQREGELRDMEKEYIIRAFDTNQDAEFFLNSMIDTHEAIGISDTNRCITVLLKKKRRSEQQWASATRPDVELPHWYKCRRCGGPISGRLSGLTQMCPMSATGEMCEKEEGKPK